MLYHSGKPARVTAWDRSGLHRDRPNFCMALKLRYEERLVTRELASKLVQDLNVRNRKLVESHVYTLSQDIKAGLFRLNPQPIIIHEDKKRASLRILDGQHRLVATSRNAPAAGVQMVFCYAQGNDADITSLQATIDSGKPRTTSDRGGFQGMGIPQGFLEKAARLYLVIGQPVAGEIGEEQTYNWMNAPKASYSNCHRFGHDYSSQLLTVDQLANRHRREYFSETRVKKEYLALVYFVAILNNAAIDSLEEFAKEASSDRSLLACKINEVWSPNHPFALKVKDASKNSSAIQYLLLRDLLQAFLNRTLTADFEPILNSREVDGTMFTEFSID